MTAWVQALASSVVAPVELVEMTVASANTPPLSATWLAAEPPLTKWTLVFDSTAPTLVLTTRLLRAPACAAMLLPAPVFSPLWP